MTGTTSIAPPELELLRRRRAELGESMAALNQALEQPAPGRVPAWGERVKAALVELSADLRVHEELTEAPGGLFTDVLAKAPRLEGAVRRLTREHEELVPGVEDLIVRADRATDLKAVKALRQACGELLHRLARHRQAGADLVYEAYVVDIGGET